MISFESNKAFVAATLDGDVDLANTGPIEDAIARAVSSEHHGFVVDLSGVTYLDSAGIRLLYRLDERASGRQQRAVFVVPPGAPANRTLEAAGAIGTLKIVATSDEATDLLKR
jgi:stage II sporulation protein AA (anti-sigma F factor antagonist)